MQVETKKDFRKPRTQVLARFRDLSRYETAFGDAGIAAERVSDLPTAKWACQIVWQDALRAFAVALTETTLDETMTMTITSALSDGTLVMDFYDLPDGGCQVIACVSLTPHTMMAKLAVKTLRLARGKVQSRVRRFLTAVGRA